MSFAEAIRTCLRKYVTFSGRATRPEYWYFVLFNILGSIVLGIVDGIVFGAAEIETGPGSVSASSDGPLSSLFSLAMLLPMIAAGWRRMHDSGRSGIFLLYPFIAVIGTLTYAGFIGAFDFADPFGAGIAAEQLEGLAGIVLVIALIVCVLSPLIVIWWLTRRTEPASNRWGPVPGTAPAAPSAPWTGGTG